jgi:uncharacterized RDD family membrane protein YckC
METQDQDGQISTLIPQLARIGRLGDRIVAVLLDLMVLFPLSILAISTVALSHGVYGDGNFEMRGAPALIAILLIGFLWIAYYAISEFCFAGTPGKLAMGIEVQSAQGGRISIRQSVVRNLLRPVDAIGLYGLGLVIALCSKRLMRLGDHAAGTVVMERQKARRSIAFAILLLLVATGFWACWLFRGLAA